MMGTNSICYHNKEMTHFSILYKKIIDYSKTAIDAYKKFSRNWCPTRAHIKKESPTRAESASIHYDFSYVLYKATSPHSHDWELWETLSCTTQEHSNYD